MWKGLLWLGAIFAALGLLYCVNFYAMTGSWLPVSRIQSLRAPIEVLGWGEDGLYLADGRTVQLPGFTRLPTQSHLLRAATRRGIEIDANGRVIGLISLWHGCGNDPVRFDLRRIDLAYMLMFVNQGDGRPSGLVPPVREVPDYPLPDDRLGLVHYGAYRSFLRNYLYSVLPVSERNRIREEFGPPTGEGSALIQ